MRRLRRAHHGPLHLRPRSQVPPRALCVRLLPAAGQPRHLQGTGREAVLLGLLRQTLRVRCAANNAAETKEMQHRGDRWDYNHVMRLMPRADVSYITAKEFNFIQHFYANKHT